MHGVQLPGWDGTLLNFFLFRDNHLRSPFNQPRISRATFRVPRGAIFHAQPMAMGRRPTPSTGTASSPPP